MAFNPITAQESVKKPGLFKTAPNPKPGTAFVYVGNSNTVVVEGSRMTWGELALGRYHTVYTVDKTQHTLDFSGDYRTCEPDEQLFVRLKIQCHVDKPKLIVDNSVSDVEYHFKTLIDKTIQDIVITRTADEFNKVREELNGIRFDNVFENLGLRIDMVFVEVNYDSQRLSEIKTKKAELKQLDDKAELILKEMKLNSKIEKIEIEHTGKRSAAWSEMLPYCPDEKLMARIIAAKNNNEVREAINAARVDNDQRVYVFMEFMEKMMNMGIDVKDIGQEMLQQLWNKQAALPQGTPSNNNEVNLYEAGEKARKALTENNDILGPEDDEAVSE